SATVTRCYRSRTWGQVWLTTCVGGCTTRRQVACSSASSRPASLPVTCVLFGSTGEVRSGRRGQEREDSSGRRTFSAKPGGRIFKVTEENRRALEVVRVGRMRDLGEPDSDPALPRRVDP